MPRMFYFAWIEEDETFDPDVHNRLDEFVLSHNITHQEGQFATLAVEIKNPRIGLLNAGRALWCFYSFDDGQGNITPLFKGRIVGIPDNIFDVVITVNFIAKPSAWATVKSDLAATMRQRPYWDDIFIAPESWLDPDTVLEARSALWHIDPVTHELTTSDVLVPEDGVMEFTAGQFLRDNMALNLQQVPLRAVTMEVVFPWLNAGAGNIDITPALMNAFPDRDPVYNLIWSYTFKGLSSDWPKTGSKLGDGWNVARGSLADLSYLNAKPLDVEFYYDLTALESLPVKGAIIFKPKISGRIWGGVDGAGFDTQVEQVIANPGWGLPDLIINYGTERDYAQTLRFTMGADVQSIVTEAGDEDAMLISLTSNLLTDVGFDPDDPAIKEDARTFLDTPRGLEAVEHAILIARANLAIRSRAVHISFQAAFERCIAVSLRKGALIHDPRLPGGQATGKIIEYSHQSSGDANVQITTIKFGSAIGRGGTRAASPGTGVYAAAGYMAAGYQQTRDEVRLAGTEDVTYEMPETVTFDDGVNIYGLTARNVIRSIFWTGGPSAQAAVINATRDANGIGDQQAVSTALKAIPTQVHLELINLNTGPHLGGVQPAVSTLVIPKQIDLEAAST